MSASSALRWRSVPRDAIVWKEWDGELVVRNERSGNSHLLGPLGGRVLQILVEAPSALPVENIVSALKHQLDPEGLDPYAAVEGVLSEFQRLGLAEPVRG